MSTVGISETFHPATIYAGNSHTPERSCHKRQQQPLRANPLPGYVNPLIAHCKTSRCNKIQALQRAAPVEASARTRSDWCLPQAAPAQRAAEPPSKSAGHSHAGMWSHQMSASPLTGTARAPGLSVGSSLCAAPSNHSKSWTFSTQCPPRAEERWKLKRHIEEESNVRGYLAFVK